MLNIKYTKLFLRQYSKLPLSIKKKTKESIKKFQKNPKDPSLKTHKLSGSLSKFYSFSVDYKIRIVFEMNKKTGEIYLLKVGGHEVYK